MGETAPSAPPPAMYGPAAAFWAKPLTSNNSEAKSSKMLTRLTMYATLEKTSNLGNKITFEQKQDVPAGLQSTVGSVFGL